MRSNPPIKGHELLLEGHSRPTHHIGGPHAGEFDGGHMGGCRCGAKPDGWPNVSVNYVKAWHRIHKDGLRWRS